jgi:regulator of RNase E activity RraA
MVVSGALHPHDSHKDAQAASAGSILVSRLMVRGAAGIVTDGGFRDSPEIARLGDGKGVVVIAAHLADEIATEASEMTALEDFVTEEVMKGRSIIGLCPATMNRPSRTSLLGARPRAAKETFDV